MADPAPRRSVPDPPQDAAANFCIALMVALGGLIPGDVAGGLKDDESDKLELQRGQSQQPGVGPTR